MDCHEAQKMITRYIRGELNRTETDEFLDHVMNCKECYDELEIYYTIDMGLKELDGVEPLFEPDAAGLGTIGDGALKINQAIPGYFDAQALRDLTGIRSAEE